MKKNFWIKFSVMMAIIVAILVLDLVTKYVFDATLEFGKDYVIIPHLFNFKLVHNMGAAWGMLAGKQIFLIALSLVFLAIFIGYYVKEKKTWLLSITFGFLIAGCLGNLFDRIFIGYVRDFIQFAFWETFPVFNFADAALTIGVVLFVIYLIVYFTRQNKEKKNAGVSVENFDENEDKNNKEKLRKNKKNAQKFDDLNKKTGNYEGDND